MHSNMSKDDIPMFLSLLTNDRNASNPNYSKIKRFVESSDINSFIQNEIILLCHREKSPFIDPEHGHI